MDPISDYVALMWMLDQQKNATTAVRNGRVVYRRLDLETLTDEECKTMFRFNYSEICRICEAMKLEPYLRYNSLKVTRELALAILLYRHSFPRRLEDMSDVFGMSPDNIGRTIRGLSRTILEKFKQSLEFDTRQFSNTNCERFSKAIFDKGACYSHIVGFIDRTVQECCQPKNSGHQDMIDNGWKHNYYNKFQVILTPDGIISSVFGPLTGKKNDREILNESRIMSRLQVHFENETPGKSFAIYGDEYYPINELIIPPFSKPFEAEVEEEANASMSKARIAVKLEFGKVTRLFSGCEWKYGNKPNQTRPVMMYMINILFKNFHTCLNRSSTTSSFGLDPPVLEEYIHGLLKE